MEFRNLVECQNDQPVKPQMFVKKIMCDPPTRDCYMRCCGLCKYKTEDLEMQIKSLCEQQEIEMVNFEMWCNTDREAFKKTSYLVTLSKRGAKVKTNSLF